MDVLAADAAAQRQALDTGVVPPAGGRRLADGSLWLILMAAGLSLTLVGVALRVLARHAPDRAGRFVTSGDTGGAAAATRIDAGNGMDDVSEPRTSEADDAGGEPVKGQPAVWSDTNLDSGNRLESGGLGVANQAADEIQEPETGRRVESERKKDESALEDESEQKHASEREDRNELEDETERKELKRFLWDSSALLTDLDDALAAGDDELAGEFDRTHVDSKRSRAPRDDSNRSVWTRPIPLPYEENQMGRDEESDEALLLTDDEEGNAGRRSDPERDSRGDRD